MIVSAPLRLQAGALYGFIERQKNLYKRYWAWEAVWFVYSLVGVLSIGYLASGARRWAARAASECSILRRHLLAKNKAPDLCLRAATSARGMSCCTVDIHQPLLMQARPGAGRHAKPLTADLAAWPLPAL